MCCHLIKEVSKLEDEVKQLKDRNVSPTNKEVVSISEYGKKDSYTKSGRTKE